VTDPLDVPDEGWFYNTTDELNGSTTAGKLAFYSGGGYIMNLGYTREQATKVMQTLLAA